MSPKKNCKHQFPCWWLAFELFPDRRFWMFPFHTLQFTLRLIMVDPCFVTSDDSVQEGVTFFIIAIQILWKMSNAFVYAALRGVLGPILHKFMKAKSIVDDFIDRTVTNLQTICHFVHSQSLSNRTMSRTRSVLSSVVAVDGRPAPSSCVSLVRTFFNFLSIRRHPVAAKHCSRIVLKVFDGFLPLVHLQTTKNGSLNASRPWCKRKAERPWLTLRLRQRNWLQSDATIAFLFSAMALLYMFRATISPIIRSTYAVYGHR